MSLSGALSNAFSGLRANSRAAVLVSSNIANATTESYGRRSLSLSSAAAGTSGGVRIDGVMRNVDPVILADRRLSDADLGAGDSRFGFASRLESATGTSDDPGSLVNRVTAFENALTNAAANPASTQRLKTVATTAEAVADTLNMLSAQIQEERSSADEDIARGVRNLNEAIERVDRINDDIVAARATGGDTSAMRDERQRLLDSVSDLVPLRVVARSDGSVAVFTTGGASLLDGVPSEVGFSKTPVITADTTFSGGALSGLTLNGEATADRLFAGGRLDALFTIRDDTAVSKQADLDAVARDLIERLGPGGPDATLAAAAPGLFTDLGAAFDPADEVGISARIVLNDLVSPDGTSLWRLRDGLGAPTQGEVGDARLLLGMSAALSERTVASSTSLEQVARSFGTQISEFSSAISAERVRSENDQAFLSGRNTSIRELEYARGVDTDQELQRLMQIEQHYAANAEVMSVVDELMERLLAI